MGTPSTIGHINNDGTVTRIYCHGDGYSSHVGRVLLRHFNSNADAVALIAGGHLNAITREGALERYATRSQWDPRVGDELWEDVQPQNVALECATIEGTSYTYLWDGEQWTLDGRALDGHGER
jgi:hypothetical protein